MGCDQINVQTVDDSVLIPVPAQDTECESEVADRRSIARGVTAAAPIGPVTIERLARRIGDGGEAAGLVQEHVVPADKDGQRPGGRERRGVVAESTEPVLGYVDASNEQAVFLHVCRPAERDLDLVQTAPRQWLRLRRPIRRGSDSLARVTLRETIAGSARRKETNWFRRLRRLSAWRAA